EFLNPFLNYHRPCLFATELPDPKRPGRIKRKYFPKDVMTPLERLARLPNAAAFLRPGLTLQLLIQRAHAITDLQAAEQLYKARSKLFGSCLKRSA
ncbi:MAG: integrase, partial [Steroidobacteraceae bacterium]